MPESDSEDEDPIVTSDHMGALLLQDTEPSKPAPRPPGSYGTLGSDHPPDTELEEYCQITAETDPNLDDDSHTDTTEGDREADPDRSYCNEAWAASIVSLGGAAFGLTFTYSSSAVPLLKENDVMTDRQTSIFSALLLLGGLFGSLVAFWLVEYTGRKLTTVLSGVPFVVGWIFIISGYDSAGLLCFGRFITGMGNGIYVIAFGVYIAEISSPEIRGIALMGFHVVNCFGVLLGYCLGIVLDLQWLAVFSMTPAALMVFGAVFLPESPRWLLMRGRQAEATAALIWLRQGDGADVLAEVSEITNNLQNAPGTVHKQNLRAEIRSAAKPLALATSLSMMVQLSGIAVIIFNIQEMMTEAGFDFQQVSGMYPVILVAVVKFVSTFVITAVVDRVGRRPPLIISGVTMGLACVVLGFFYWFQDSLDQDFMWIPVACMLIYIIGYSIGWGGVVWLVIPEILPFRVRGFGAALSTSMSWITSFAMAASYQFLLDTISFSGLFWMFGVLCVLGSLYVHCVVPETMQRSLEEIETHTLSRSNSKK